MVIFPNTIKEIERDAFNWTGISSIALPKSLETIGEKAFHFNLNLSGTLVIPNKVKVIPKEIFSHAHIDTLIIEGAESIKRGAFECCTSLKRVILPNSLKIIESSAFKATKIKKIIFPVSLEKVEGSNFPENSHLAFLSDNTNVCLGYWHEYTDGYSGHKGCKAPIIYCNLGSKAHLDARDKGLEVKPLSEFPKD